MASKLKTTYRFAFRSSIYITLFLTILIGIFLYSYYEIDYYALGIFAVLCFVFSFIIIQTRIQLFIYRRVKQIYDDVALLDASTLERGKVTTDMETLKEQVGKFAQGKKIEIEALKLRDAYRREFMGNISHELKTPLFTVQGYIDTLVDGAHKDKTIRKKYLGRASKGVDRLIYIVNDLDLITKLEMGEVKIKKQHVDIVQMVQNVFDLLEMKAAKKKISLTFDTVYDEPILINADSEKIQQVLINLIVNSIKYGKANGTTEVSIEDLIKDKVIVRVTDNGEGIEKRHIPRLFERFYRVDKSGSRKEGGSGLGLSIVKHIIEAHDEKIYVESEPGIGSEFSFTLEKASINNSPKS